MWAGGSPNGTVATLWETRTGTFQALPRVAYSGLEILPVILGLRSSYNIFVQRSYIHANTSCLEISIFFFLIFSSTCTLLYHLSFFFFLLLKQFRRVTSAKSNRASSSENSLLVKSSEKTGKNGQNQFLKTLKVNQGSSAFQEVFSQ